MIPESRKPAEVPDVPARLLYPVNDAAVLLGISPRKTWDLVYDRKLRTVWVEGRRLVPADVLKEYVAGLPEAKPEMSAA